MKVRPLVQLPDPILVPWHVLALQPETHVHPAPPFIGGFPDHLDVLVELGHAHADMLAVAVRHRGVAGHDDPLEAKLFSGSRVVTR